MRIYLSAQWSRRDEIEGYAERLREAGHDVVSRWHSGMMGDDRRGSIKDWRRWAHADLSAIDRCEAFIAFTEPQGTYSRGGRHVEWGYALANQLRPVEVVGPFESQFYALADQRWDDVDDMLRIYTAAQRFEEDVK